MCLTMSIFSQEKVDIAFLNTPILDVIKQVESNFKVKFSFDSNIIQEKVYFTFNKKNCQLEELLTEIETQASLQFNKVDARYYYISVFKESTFNNYNLLKEVQISNYVTLGINKNKNGSISVLPQQLGVLPGLTEPDVLESLKIIPGVQSPNETASGIYIRGGTPDQNLIFWDGIKMYYSGHFFGTLSAFNPYTTKKITLSKSGTQARYGNRISGVIDIKTQENIPSKVSGGFGFNMTHFDAFLKIPLSKKMAFTTSFRRSFTDLINTFTFDKLSERVFQTFDANHERRIINKSVPFERDNRFYFADYTAKLAIKPSENEALSFNFLYTKNKLVNNFKIPIYQDNYLDDLNITNKGLSFLWNKKLSSTLTQDFKAFYSNFNLNYSGKYNYIKNYLIRHSIKTNSVRDLGFSYNLNYKVNTKTDLLFGYDFLSNETSYKLNYRADINSDNITNTLQEDSGTNNTHSFFTEFLYDNDNWRINSGLRLNHFDKINKTVIEPRLYIEKRINDGLSFKTSLEQKHQPLSQIIEFQTSSLGFDLENQVWAQVNNSNIPLQKSFQFSLGTVYNKNGWKIDVEPYLKYISGMTSQTRGYNDQTTDFSKGKGEIFGIDFLINKKIGNYRTWINYSYTKNKFKFIDLENKFFPANHDITNYFSWSHAFKFNNYEFSFGWKHRTGNPFTDVREFRIDPNSGSPTIILDTDNINAKRLPKYHRLDASVTYSFRFPNKWKGKLGFSILNIYNQKNILRRTFTAVPVVNSNNQVVYQLGKIDKLSLGITPNLVFRVNF